MAVQESARGVIPPINAARGVAAFIAAKRKEIATVALGQSIWTLIGWFYNNPLYIAAIAIYGPLAGGALMTCGSLVICLGMVIWYNRHGVDWLGVGAVDAIRKLALRYAEKLAAWRASSFGGLLLFVVFYLPIRLLLVLARLANHAAWGDATAFVLLSIFEDPFTTTVYLRHGYYGPMTRRDWSIFIGSMLLSNGYWILRTTVVIELALAIWRAL